MHLSQLLLPFQFYIALFYHKKMKSQVSKYKFVKQGVYILLMSIVRCIDDLGRVVIPKEIRRTMRIREGDPLLTTLTPFDKFCWAIHSVVERYNKTAE